MRSLFIILRSTSYLAILIFLIATGQEDSWTHWLISLIVVGWNSWDQWKKPTDSIFHMRLGVILESVLIVLWSVILHQGVILFLLISPLMRASIHLSVKDDSALISTHIITIVLLQFTLFDKQLPLSVLLGTLIGCGLYSLVLGLLLKHREQARRHIAATAFEREQYNLDQERMRIAGQLHDVMGQHWASIVRALDVALVTQGEQSLSFVRRARETALQGLQDMRSAVHDWQDGRQTPHQWMDYLKDTVIRYREITGLNTTLEIQPIEWNRLDNAVATAELLVRSSMEAMTNAVRHAEASNISVTILNKEHHVELIVQDNGKGIHINSDAIGSGISSIKRRIALHNGHFKLYSAFGEGTTLRLTLPYMSLGAEKE